jgi:hypothetical protein
MWSGATFGGLPPFAQIGVPQIVSITVIPCMAALRIRSSRSLNS